VGRLRRGKGRLSLLTGLQLRGDAAVEIPQVLHQLLLLLLVLEAGGEADLLAHPLLAGRLVHQRHVAEPLADGGKLLLLLPRPLMGLDRNGGVELGAGHPFEQGRTLVGARLEEGGKLPLGQDDGAAKLLPGESHQLVDAILQLPLAATEYLARRHVGQAALLGLKAPLGAVARPAHRPAGQPDRPSQPRNCTSAKPLAWPRLRMPRTSLALSFSSSSMRPTSARSCDWR
jgi:hypothetical protein